MSSTGAAKGAVRPRAITLLVFLAWEGHIGFESLPYRALPSSFYKLSRSYRLNMESQSWFVFRCETKRKSKKCNSNTPEIWLRTKTGYIRRAGSFSACPKFRKVPAVMLVCLSDYVRSPSSKDQSSVINACIPSNVQCLYSLAQGVLALSVERSSWLTSNSSNCGQHSAPVYISRPKQNVCEHGSTHGMCFSLS